jgi:hypothetical protein
MERRRMSCEGSLYIIYTHVWVELNRASTSKQKISCMSYCRVRRIPDFASRFVTSSSPFMKCSRTGTRRPYALRYAVTSPRNHTRPSS